MSVLAVTLARGGSKGIPSKNSKVIAGKPLIQWTIDEACKSELIDKYVVSSDNSSILSIAAANQVAQIQRPAELAGDTTPSLDALQHAVRECEQRWDRKWDYIVDLRCTSPLKTAVDIDNAIKMAIRSDSIVVGTTRAEPVERIKVIYGGYLMDTYPEPLDGVRQKLRSYYVRNGTFYIVPRYQLMENDILFANGVCRAFNMPRERSVNIDDEFDWKVAECLLQSLE